MKLIHKDFDFCFDFKENRQGLLVVESPCLFRKFVNDFIQEESSFVLSENNAPINLAQNIACLLDFFNINLNERKILTRLIELIKKEVLNSELLLSANSIIGEMENFAEEVCINSDFVLSYNEKIDLSALFKLLDFKLKDINVEQLESIVDYIKINSEILGIKLFVFVNAFAYFEAAEISELIKFVNYNKLNALFAESAVPENYDDFDMVYVIDKDCCQICLKDV